jgi:hypothetical protein
MLLTSGFPGKPAIWHMQDQPLEERLRLHGRGYIDPLGPVAAGDFLTVAFHFEAGECEIPTGGRLRIVWLWPYDWASPQADDPSGEAYMSVSTTTEAELEEPVVRAKYRRRGDLIPWNHEIELTLTQGRLRQGDRLQLLCGDRSGGGRGWRAPTFAAKSAEILLLINPDGSDQWIQLPEPPRFPILAKPPVRLVALSPATGVVGESLEVIVRAEDEWDNPALVPQGTPQLALRDEGEEKAATLGAAQVCGDPPVYRFSVCFDQPGIYRINAAVPGTSLQTESNPVHIHAERPPLQLFWGDLHSGQGEIGCGVGSVAEHYAYCRDVAALQFTTHQGNDHHITLDMWEQVRRETEVFNEPGRFVTFLGCEWSAFTEDGGDRNVVYRHDEPRLRRSGRFFTEKNPDPEPDLVTAPEFHRALRNEEVLINMHAGGRTTNLNYHAAEIEPLAEIHSTHGTSEWFVLDALERGYKIGITGGTDGVAGRPGADHPGHRLIRNVRSGFTAVYAKELSRDGLWEALQARRCYATSGARILLWVDVDGQPMGAECETDGLPLVSLSAEGTAPIEQVDLLCGTSVLSSWRMAPAADGERTLRVLWGGTEKRGTAPDQRVLWDGSLKVSGGRFVKAESIGFQSPCDVLRQDAETLSWSFTGAGNRAGFTLEFEGDGATEFHFSTGPCSFDFRSDQVNLAPMRIDAGGVGRHVEVGPAPREDGPRTVDLTYRDTRRVSGVCPYWIRIVQTDQARAWSSPVYMTRRA